MHKYCYISRNKDAFLLLIFTKAGESIWPMFAALAISTPEKNSAGNWEIPQRHPQIENLVYDKKKHDHTRAEYRIKKVSIEMIIMKASKVIIIRSIVETYLYTVFNSFGVFLSCFYWKMHFGPISGPKIGIFGL